MATLDFKKLRRDVIQGIGISPNPKLCPRVYPLYFVMKTGMLWVIKIEAAYKILMVRSSGNVRVKF